jgi:hypothetical protein
MGPRAGLDAGDRRKILCPCQGSNPDRPARRQTLNCLSYRCSWRGDNLAYLLDINCTKKGAKKARLLKVIQDGDGKKVE